MDSWDEWIGHDCVLKHTEENIEEQGIKQGVKSAMAWRVSKVKPRCPNGQCSGSFIRGFVACFIDHMLDIIIILLLIYFAVARGRKRKQDSVDTLVSPMVWIFLSFFSIFQVCFYCFLISFCLIVFVVCWIQEENLVATDNLLTFNIPSALRKQLIDDYEFVTQMQKVALYSLGPYIKEFISDIFCNIYVSSLWNFLARLMWMIS